MCDEPLANFRSVYADFHSDLRKFVSCLSQRFTPGAPSILQHVGIIPSVLEPSDDGFCNGNEKDIMIKYRVVLESTELVLEKVEPFVKHEHRGWFRSDGVSLTGKLRLVKFAALSLPFSGGQKASLLSCGVSGVNKGVQYDTDFESLIKLKEMYKMLLQPRKM